MNGWLYGWFPDLAAGAGVIVLATVQEWPRWWRRGRRGVLRWRTVRRGVSWGEPLTDAEMFDFRLTEQMYNATIAAEWPPKRTEGAG